MCCIRHNFLRIRSNASERSVNEHRSRVERTPREHIPSKTSLRFIDWPIISLISWVQIARCFVDSVRTCVHWNRRYIWKQIPCNAVTVSWDIENLLIDKTWTMYKRRVRSQTIRANPEMQTSLFISTILGLCGALLAANAPPEVKACTQTVKAGEQVCLNIFNQQMTSPGKESEDQLQQRECCSYWRFKKCSLDLFVANHNNDCLQKLLNYFTSQEKAQQLPQTCAKWPAIDNPNCKPFQ